MILGVLDQKQGKRNEYKHCHSEAFLQDDLHKVGLLLVMGEKLSQKVRLFLDLGTGFRCLQKPNQPGRQNRRSQTGFSDHQRRVDRQGYGPTFHLTTIHRLLCIHPQCQSHQCFHGVLVC